MTEEPQLPSLTLGEQPKLQLFISEDYSEKLLQDEYAYKDDEYPLVSIIIPTLNCAHLIDLTIENLLDQEYPLLEIIIIDAGSTDRTLEVVKSYRQHNIRVYSVSSFFRYEMLNKGISLASGLYLNFLFPGDFYISRTVLKYMMGMALAHSSPHLVFSGTLLRDGKAEVKILYRELSENLLKRGQQPTSIESCWFRKDVFQMIGKFDTSYELRGGYELLCRFLLKGDLQYAGTSKILTDYDLRFVTQEMVLIHFKETFRTIYRYFGFVTLLKWLMIQKDGKRYLKLWYRRLHAAFMGRYG